MVVGVNGAGKTTSIGKLAHRFKGENKKVILAAADTFRAAAIDQLQVWADRVGVELIKHQEGSDPERWYSTPSTPPGREKLIS
jgi:fused signal recognition particle receptor